MNSDDTALPALPVEDKRAPRDVPEYEPFAPILDRILLSRVESDKDSSGFTIPDKYREPEAKGIVVAIGDGVVLGGQWRPMSEFVNVGDRVLFGANTVEKIELDGKEFEIARLQDIRGVERMKRPQFLENSDLGAGVLDRIANIKRVDGIIVIKVLVAGVFVPGLVCGVYAADSPYSLRGWLTIASVNPSLNTITITGELPAGTGVNDLLVLKRG